MDTGFRSKVISYILDNNLLKKGSSILLSLSAGKDSIALYHFILSIKKEWDLSVSVFHLNHCMRGAESDADEAFLAALCVRDGLPFYTARHDFKVEDTSGFEEKARAQRYTRIDRLVSEHGFDAVLTAHTTSDSVETVIMRIVTGTHIHGLTGIPSRRLYISRPLLCVTSDEVYSYLKQHGIPWRDDMSNEDCSYSRNFIRHEIIPALAARFPRTVSSIADLSDAAAAQELLVRKLAAAAGLIMERTSSEIRYRHHPLLTDRDIFNYCIADLMHQLGIFVSGEKLSEAFRRFQSPKGKAVLYEDQEIYIEKDFRFAEKFIRTVRKGDQINNNSVYRRDFDIILCCPVTISDIPLPIHVYFAEKNEFILHCRNPLRVYISADLLGSSVTVRNKQDGDTVTLKGSKKKLKFLFSAIKCDAYEKNSIPVIESSGEIAAVCIGFCGRGSNRVSDTFKVTDDTKKILAICRTERDY